MSAKLLSVDSPALLIEEAAEYVSDPDPSVGSASSLCVRWCRRCLRVLAFAAAVADFMWYSDCSNVYWVFWCIAPTESCVDGAMLRKAVAIGRLVYCWVLLLQLR